MERLYQMHVIPDILPSLQPTVDLRVVFPEAPPKNVVLRARAKRETVSIEAGVFLVNEQVNASTEAVDQIWSLNGNV
jgi:large subunit ribosomal protein L35